jgi:hypothetical protein
MNDVVAVGRRNCELVLATPALSPGAHWRFRRLALAGSYCAVESIVLSQGGTKLLLVFHTGAYSIVDLTSNSSLIRMNEVNAPSGGRTPLYRLPSSVPTLHRLPGQTYAVARHGEVCLLDDIPHLDKPACQAGAQGVVLGDGRTLHAAADGTLTLVGSDASQTKLLPYRIPTGARYELLGGHAGDRHASLLLVAEANQVRVLDPRLPQESLGSYPTWELAGLHAMLEFSPLIDSSSQPAKQPNQEARLMLLAANLVKEAPPGTQWCFFRVKPELALYAPVLEFAPHESAFPSDVGIWDVLNPIAKGHTREDYQQAYDTLGDQRWKRCAVYSRAESYPGSWLLEYWYYYPFDEGKPHRHIHDSEHVFIEVDKLGGTVRSFLASDHGSFAPNNGYSTFLPGAQPITLPLFALVELDKHAMAPDINRDGQFTRRGDENLHSQRYATWGVRDLATQPQYLMKPYNLSMTLPRAATDRLAPREAQQFFPGNDVPADRSVCSLLSLPDDAPPAASPPQPSSCQDCGVPDSRAAMTHLLDHADSQHPEAIYKSWVLPFRQLRIGLGLFDHYGNHDQLYAAYVLDLPHLTRGALPVPGRVALETMWSPTGQDATQHSGGHTVSGRVSSEIYLGVRYEGFFSHTQGYYFGVTPHILQFTTNAVDGLAVVPTKQWQFGGVWYRAGYLFELPSRTRGNMTHHVGIVFHGRTFRMEWRVSFGVLRQRGRSHFGISPKDP